MATEKPRFTITLEPETFDQVLNFKKNNGIATQSGAIQRLVERGIQDLISSNNLTSTKKAPSLSDEAMKVAVAFDKADEDHKEIVRTALSKYLAAPAQKGNGAKLA